MHEEMEDEAVSRSRGGKVTETAVPLARPYFPCNSFSTLAKAFW
jgi:hypothetical protein